MGTLRCCKQLSAALTKTVLQENAGFARTARWIPRARHNAQHRSRSFAASFASCRAWRHRSARHFGARRCYSELSDCRDSPRSTDELPEGIIDETETDSSETSQSQKSLEGFTLDVLVSLLRQENAVDICVIKVSEQLKYANYFIVVSGVSPRHLRAMAFYAVKVYKYLKTNEDVHIKMEGEATEDWMCIDFGKMVVHFMLPETREKYELEKLWTLRSYDEQLKSIPPEVLPEDFFYGLEVTK
ncbi:mitochondrial assembly of ribosomal large subunit protein 1 [Lampris incognitus]|uniref:mitochondrial assembly of ribosomal large subunit protein 1 n=1 Tax=Lampris incognitus TaxID=2546036 RepID=UPI0024B4D7E0|nr:mitochondrial assembly of ribosomal large subunit protein 1 [Lampris incognitus]